MTTLEQKAHEVILDYMALPLLKAPSLLLDFESVIGIITTLIGMIKNCRKKPEAAVKMMRRFGPVQKARVNQAIKDRFGKANQRLAASVATVAKECREQDVLEMYDEI